MAEQDKAAQIGFTRDDEFIAEYANNVQFEPSAFDLKLIFGELEQHEGRVQVRQHTSMTLSWLQAKLAMFYLELNVAAYELQNGKIEIPDQLLPASPDTFRTNVEDNPAAKQLFEAFKTLRERLLSSV